MSFPKYEQYRRSGATWVGDIPAHWRVAALRWVARRYAGGTPDKANLDYWSNGTIPWLNSGSVNQRMITEASEYITEDAYSNSSARWVPEGALVMALAGQGKTKGMVAQLAIRATCNQSMAAIIPVAGVNPRYLYWWLDAQYQNIRNLAGGDLRDGLNLDLLGQIPCPLPAKDEQSSIALFLDRETAKIGALVAAQERLIELLEDKRQAVISHAVTKGLDPAVPMRYSGVSWLGSVPDHWNVLPLKRHCRLLTNKTDRRLFPVALENIESWTGRYVPSDSEFEGEGIAFEKGDILFGKLRPYLAKAWVAPQSGEAIGDFLVIRPDNRAVSRFTAYQILSREFISIVDGATFGTKMPRASWEIVGAMSLPLPSPAEQSAIVIFLDRETAKIDALIFEANQTIALLQERRSALISAAVTGKIDVRQLELA
jgi:type I restriction enzyme S subunit